METQLDGPILVVGATGNLGTLIVRDLREAGRDVRAAVRTSAPHERKATLEQLGAEIVTLDLKDPPSLEAACRGASIVVSTATAIVSRQPGDTLESVDEHGQLALIDTCARSGVRHFVFVSVAPGGPEIAFVRAKRRVEARLASSGMTFTCLRPAPFMEVWLGPETGFDPAKGFARVFGAGDKPVSWVSALDVARFASAAAQDPARFRNLALPMGGPESISQLDVLRIFRESGAHDVKVEQVPPSALEARLREASDPFAEAMAALCLGIAFGIEVDCRQALSLLPGRMKSIRDYARQRLTA